MTANYKDRVMSKPTVSPLVDESGDICGFIAKGEHTAAAMQDAIRYYGVDDYEFTGDFIETRHFRWIPQPPGSEMPYDKRLEPSKPGRGAFLATYVELR